MITVAMATSIIYHYFTSFISLLLLMFPMLPAPHFLDAHVPKQCIPARVREWIITVPHEVDTVDIMIIHLYGIWISIIHYYPLLMHVWVNYVWFHYLWLSIMIQWIHHDRTQTNPTYKLLTGTTQND